MMVTKTGTYRLETYAGNGRWELRREFPETVKGLDEACEAYENTYDYLGRAGDCVQLVHVQTYTERLR